MRPLIDGHNDREDLGVAVLRGETHTLDVNPAKTKIGPIFKSGDTVVRSFWSRQLE
jgi:hypothetical protein